MNAVSRRKELLERAALRCFFFDLDDAAARLCRANMPFGMARILFLQESLGMAPDACWISTPDSTVTRNLDRWRSGFGYGGAATWSGDLMPLELKPNFCGMLVAGLLSLPDVTALRLRIERIAETTLDVRGVPVHWDMHRGNHFINLYEVSDPAVTSGHPYVVVMHSSGSELRGPGPMGPGLYLSPSDDPGALWSMATVMETPFGEVPYLTGERAALFHRYCEMVESFSRARREAYARAILGEDVPILFNEMHQGMDGPNRMLLGAYRTSRQGLSWVPVTLRADLPAFLVAPLEVYSEKIVEREGMLERARATGCLDRLLKADLLPHGGGYAYPDMDAMPIEVEDRGPGQRPLFRARGKEWFEDARDLAFTYRGEAVIRRIEELGAGRVAARLDPVARLEG